MKKMDWGLHKRLSVAGKIGEDIVDLKDLILYHQLLTLRHRCHLGLPRFHLHPPLSLRLELQLEGPKKSNKKVMLTRKRQFQGRSFPNSNGVKLGISVSIFLMFFFLSSKGKKYGVHCPSK